MKVLIIGNGGRENALCWKIRQNPSVELCQMVPAEPKEALLATALSGGYDLTVVGPEGPLNDGIVDLFKAQGLRIFGPSRAGAKLESSKIDAKTFMGKYGIQTAPYEVFDDFDASKSYLRGCRFPVVIKADGLANGKGVLICHTFEEGEKALEDLMVRKYYNKAGERVIIETFLEGFEASLLCITDGVTIKPFISAMDYKRAEDRNRGLNTGGMGAIAPNPFLNPSHLEVFEKEIMERTLNGIQNEKIDYHGFLYFGLMVTGEGIFLLEYNVRLGDPETQAVLPLMKSDLVDLMLAALKDELGFTPLTWLDKRSCCVVACSGGYPLTFHKHKRITGLERVENNLFFSGVYQKDGEYFTNAGRVLSINAVDDSPENARSRCYKDLRNVSFDGMYYRRDIGKIEEGGR